MIIVTGANGFIGSAIVWQMNQAKIPVLACVDKVPRNERPHLLENKSFDQYLLKDDLWDFLDLEETISKVTWVIHMGANSSTTETDWEHLYDNNTLYTRKIFEWCAKHGKSFIYASSAATYGAGEVGYDDNFDSERLKPLNLYGESKVQFDRWALKAKKVPPHWYGLKFFNVYGPNEYHKEAMSSVAFKAYHQIQKSGSLQLFRSHKPDYQDGEQKRDFVYVKDVTQWILELTQKQPKSGIYNMGFGTARTWLDLARAVFASSAKTEQIDFIEMPDNIRDQYQYYTCANMEKWLAQGMSAPRWSLEAGVGDYIKNYLGKSNTYL
jgi:ADP-L-glycero-D-manno-heptose 6-epimerase